MTPHRAAASAAGPAARLQVADWLKLPLEAVTETFAILAKRRAGKSNATVVPAEEMFDHGLPWVAVDPKGDWSTDEAHGRGWLGVAEGLQVSLDAARIKLGQMERQLERRHWQVLLAIPTLPPA